MSSHRVVDYIRKLMKIKKVGHTGTLDPGAAGLLPVCIGKATRIAPFLLNSDKTYVAEMTFGVATKSYDGAGKTTNVDLDLRLTPNKFGKVLSSFIGDIEQIPPMTSAVRVGGKQLYKLERQGITVDRKPRKIVVKDIHVNLILPEKSVLTFGSQVLLNICCSKGTYIRTLCHDIGRALNTYAHMSFLVRILSGPFSIQQGYTLEEIKQYVAKDDYSFVLGIEKALPEYPHVQVTPEAEKRVLNGNYVLMEDLFNISKELGTGDQVLLFSASNQLLAIAEIKYKNGLLCQPIRVLKEGN